MSATVTIGKPHMTAPEQEFFDRALTGCRRYLEFGVGGSSLVAVRKRIGTIVSVDSDLAWVQAVRQHPEIAPRIANGSMAVLHGDIGPVREWGNPKDRGAMHRWPNYIATGWAEWARRFQMPDVVFVDGRFRIACCLSLVVVTGAGRSLAAPRLLLHDLSDQRPQYQSVHEFFDVAEQVETLHEFRMRPDADPVLALTRLLREQFEFG